MNPAEPLPNERHEAFAVHYAANGNAAKAWLHAGGDNPKTANRQGDKWVKRGDIVTRVAWIRSEVERKRREAAEKENESALLTVAEKRAFLASVVRASVATTEDGSPLWQEIEIKPDSIKRKMPDKLRAIALDNDLAGDGSEAAAAAALPEIAEALFDRLFPAA
jgi:hypothetical protein